MIFMSAYDLITIYITYPFISVKSAMLFLITPDKMASQMEQILTSGTDFNI